MTPIIILAGNAGSGKDTVATYLINRYGAAAIGQADILKHIARDLFGFDDDRLFGPSECRNEIDVRFDKYIDEPNFWMDVVAQKIGVGAARLPSCPGFSWARRIFPDRAEEAHNALIKWFDAIIVPRAQQDHGLSARLVLQTLGTEWGRALDHEVWARHARTIALKLVGGGHHYSREAGVNIDPDLKPYNLAVITDGRFANEIVGTQTIGGIAVKVSRNANMRAAVESAGVKGHASEAELDQVPAHFFDYILNNNFDIPGLQHQIDVMVSEFWGNSLKPIQRFAK